MVNCGALLTTSLSFSVLMYSVDCSTPLILKLTPKMATVSLLVTIILFAVGAGVELHVVKVLHKMCVITVATMGMFWISESSLRYNEHGFTNLSPSSLPVYFFIFSSKGYYSPN